MQKVLLIGCPNAGKSAVFNLITGKNRKVANYSGVTVDFATAPFRSNAVFAEQYELVDLPGIYTLCPHTEDEAVTVAALVRENRELKSAESVIIVLDFTRMESSLKLLLAVQSVWKGSLLAVVNKCDTDNQKERILSSHLEKELGIPLFPVSALNDLADGVDSFIRKNITNAPCCFGQPMDLSVRAYEEFKQYFPTAKENDNVLIVEEDHVHQHIEDFGQKSIELAKKLHKKKNCPRYQQTVAMDRILLHPLWGIVFFILTFYLIFSAIYSWSAPFMDMIDYAVSNFGNFIGGYISNDFIRSFLVDGLIAGMGASLVFLPQIFILFFLISLLNQSGYISRASILTDHLMSRFGLNGKAFLPFLSAFACSVPAIMATRTIKDRKERLATIMVLPFITCSARLPVYILLIGTFVPKGRIWGFVDRQALAFFFLYFLGTVVALVFAKLFRLSFFRGKSTSFVIELPHYQRPRIVPAFKESVAQAKIFLRKVGTIILVFSMLIWILSTFPQLPVEQKVGKTSLEQSAIALEYSYIGKMGRAIEPVIKPLGFDWKMGVGILSAFAARELFVSTLGTIYALGDVDENSNSLRERILKERDPITGKPIYNTAVAWSLIIFFAFACQCMSTLAIVRRESESRIFPLLMFIYMLGFAYISSYSIYHLLV